MSGAVTGFQSFTVVGNGNTTYYSATDATGGWEVGIGTYSTTGPTLTRTTILSSSNSGSAVTFSGTVNVFLTYPSGKSVNLDASGNVSALGTVASGTWQGSTLAIAYGGTNSTATPTAGGTGYGTGTAHAYTAAGTSGQALISAGASAPAFGALAIGTANTNISGALTVTNGGTGLATLTANYIPYGNGTGALQSSSNFTYNGTALSLTSTGNAVNFTTTLVGGDCFSFNCTGTTSSVYGIGVYSSASAANTAYLFRGYNSLSTLAFSINGAGTILNGSWQATAIGTAYGGTGATSAQAGMNALAGAVTSGSYLRGNGTNVVMNTIQAADVPTLNQNTTGSSGSCTGNSATATTATTANALNTANSYQGVNFTATGSLVVGSSGTYTAGSLYSDSNWGMVFRAKQASPAAAQFMWSDAAGTELFRYSGSTLSVNVSGSSGSCTGNSATATTLIGDSSNWASYRSSAVANMLSWKNYGNGHVIFDASASTSPSGSAVNNTNSQAAWSGSYPTLMGWNGSTTYGVRVDSARISDNGIWFTYAAQSRGANTTYTNSTGRAIVVLVATASSGGAWDPTPVVGGVGLGRSGATGNIGSYAYLTFLVADGQTYSVNGTFALDQWSECRT